ncbi:maleylpyruvate isomerase N-terminal domain-containing protein [Micrococcus sp. IITD107]|uniref:maleylpyruvate isomerase N-terminal domain-containing protein n=1 Tax=Micrococcus sp. IITD107 TaxID=3342790 RepID=UPI0035B7764D
MNEPSDRSDLAAAWTAAAEPFTAVVESVQDWSAASSCEGWTAADVLDHVMQTQREFVERHGREVPLWDGEPEQPEQQWFKHQAAMAALIGDEDFAAQSMETPFGPSTVGQTLLGFYGFDLIVHRWDIARSQGRDEQLTDAELNTVDAAVDGFGEHAYAPGIFQEPVDVPAGATRQQQVLARTGRSAV